MASLTLPYPDFVAGTTIVSQQVDDNNTAITNYINARNAGSANWDAVSTIGSFISTATTNQLVLGTTRTVTVSAPTPASASRTVTLPDLSADYSVLGTVGTQTITGAKTFSAITTTFISPSNAETVHLRGRAADNIGALLFKSNDGATGYGNLEFGPTYLDGYVSSTKVFHGVTTGFAILGTTTNDNAAAGFVGEVATSTVAAASAVTSSGSSQYFDVTSISLTAGDWDVDGIISLTANGGTVTQFVGGISQTSGNSATGIEVFNSFIPTAAFDASAAVPGKRYSLSGTTTIYLKAFSVFSVASSKAYGRISARRRR